MQSNEEGRRQETNGKTRKNKLNIAKDLKAVVDSGGDSDSDGDGGGEQRRKKEARRLV